MNKNNANKVELGIDDALVLIEMQDDFLLGVSLVV
jgi:hypothetical protein